MEPKNPLTHGEKTMIKPWKNLTWKQWLVVLLLGLLLAVIAMPFPKTKEESIGIKQNSFTQTASDSAEETTGQSQMEIRLKGILEQMEGVGKVEVLTYTSKEEFLFSQSNEENQPVLGVLIVAQGGDDPVTVKKIQDAVLALFPIEAHKLKVMKMK